jgi:hypothetical protein
MGKGEGLGQTDNQEARTCKFPFTLYLFPLDCGLPFHRAFLGRVDLGLFRHGESFAKQVAFDVVEKEVLCVRTGEIQAVVIDDLRLLL